MLLFAHIRQQNIVPEDHVARKVVPDITQKEWEMFKVAHPKYLGYRPEVLSSMIVTFVANCRAGLLATKESAPEHGSPSGSRTSGNAPVQMADYRQKLRGATTLAPNPPTPASGAD
jgi:hypothetical protein